MGYPLSPSGGGAAGAPIFHNCPYVHSGGTGERQNRAVDLPDNAEWKPNSFLILPAVSRIPQTPGTASTGDNFLTRVRIGKNGTSQLKFNANINVGVDAGDTCHIPVIEVPTRRPVIEHELTWTTPGNANSPSIKVQNIPAVTPGFGDYDEGSPVMMTNYMGSIQSNGSESIAQWQQYSFIKADGSFDFIAKEPGNNEVYTLWIQVMPL